MTNLKKYTNADFYKNGVFQQEIAIEAMKEMFVHYNIPFTGFMAENMVTLLMPFICFRDR